MTKSYLTESTLSPVIKQDLSSAGTSNDMLVRIISENESKNLTIIYDDTRTVLDNLSTKINDMHSQNISLLRSVIFWQKRTIDYQALYTAFLLNSLSEEDFEQEADKFTVHQIRIPPEKIAFDIERLYSLIGIKFDTSDYADYFQCSQENMMEGLRLLPSEHFAEMLPSPKKS